MSDLDEGVDPSWHLSILFDPKRQERLKTLYDIDFEVVGDDDVWIREAERHEAKSERLEKREMELAAEWQKRRAQQQAEAHASSPQTSLEDCDPEISVKPLAILREHTLVRVSTSSSALTKIRQNFFSLPKLLP